MSCAQTPLAIYRVSHWSDGTKSREIASTSDSCYLYGTP
jgi:hypothetical protein